jgi:outer membrane protein TolC
MSHPYHFSRIRLTVESSLGVIKVEIMKTKPRAGVRVHKLLLALFCLPGSLLAEPVSLQHAVELALKHANGAAIAADDEQHASAVYRELRNSYVPQVTAGAGLGWSYGFPLSLEGAAPSLFNINAQSALLHSELRSFIRAAQSECSAASFRSKDQRNQIIQETVLSYAELEKWEQRLARLHEAEPEAQKMQEAIADRVKEGIDSELDGTRARLSEARLRLRIAEAQGAVDVLRERLSKLTGLPAAGIQTETESIPALSVVAKDKDAKDEDAPAKAAESSPAVQSAVEHARAQYLRAQGEHKSLLPTVDFAAQYALLSTYNNYSQFYRSFQQNNATVGVAIRFSFLNSAQRSRAQAADADARKAKSQADAARNQVSEETLRLQRSVTQMQAARDVADLEYQITQKNVESVQTRMNSATANLHDLDNARTQASERFIALQDVTFELERSQVLLLRATGDLETWALKTK